MEPPRVTAAPRDEASANLFWNAVTPEGEYSHEYDTLGSIVKDVDLIVVGTIANVYMADVKTTNTTWPSIWAQFQVEEVLKGSPVSRSPGFIDVVLTSSPAWQWAEGNVPDEQMVLFLMNEEAYRARVGQESVDRDVEHFEYWRPDEQAVVRNVDGKVGVIDTDRMLTDFGPDVFPMTVLDDNFDATVSAIRKSSTK